MEKLLKQFMFKDSLLVHLPDFWTEALVGELANVIAKQNFVVGKRYQWLWERCDRSGNLDHVRNPLQALWQTKNCITCICADDAVKTGCSAVLLGKVQVSKCYKSPKNKTNVDRSRPRLRFLRLPSKPAPRT